MAKHSKSSSTPRPALNAPVMGNITPPIAPQRTRPMDAVEAAKVASAAEPDHSALDSITGLQPLTPVESALDQKQIIRAQFTAVPGKLPEDTGAVRGCSALYRVSTARLVRLGGSTQTFKVGRMFDTALYPPGTLDRLLEQGLHLELVRAAETPTK